MKIVIIGMDNTGKTTLVKKLSEDYNIKSFKSPGPNFTKEEMMDQINKNLSLEESLILERFPIVEELIYGTILRKNSKFTFEDLIEKGLKEYSPLFIYCRPSDQNIFNFGEREQMEGVIERSKELLKGFDELTSKMKDSGFNIITYDYETKTIEDLEEEINEYNTCKKRRS